VTKEQFAYVNAALNGLSAVLLMFAYLAIQKQKYRRHGWLMSGALLTSIVFLGFYITSYVLFGDRSSKDLGIAPWLRTSYLLMLASHVILAVAMLPLIVLAVWHAARRNWAKHRRIARPAFWIWLYVSVTGVLVYWMLYQLFPRLAQST
jgi:uncharacterized membrane protein YozB (DUF420 family)